MPEVHLLCPECARKRGFTDKDADGHIEEHVCPDCNERALCCGYSWPVPRASEVLGPRQQHPHACPHCAVMMELGGFNNKNPRVSSENCPKCGTYWQVEVHGAKGPGTPEGDSYGITFTYWK